MALQRVASHQRRRLVGREEAEVVLQDEEVVDEQPPVRGVGVDHVDCSGGRRLVLRRLQDRLDVREAETVGVGEPGQAVPAFHELVAEAGAQGRRDRHEVADRAQFAFSRAGEVGPDRQLVRVLEPDRRQPVEIEAPEELGPDGCQRLELGGGRLLAEQGDEAGAGVLGVEVDAAGTQRLEAELRAGEAEPPLDLDFGMGLDQLGEDLAEQAVLGEVLRSDHDRPARRLRARLAFLRRSGQGDRQGQDREQQRRLRHVSWPRDPEVRRRTGRRGCRSVLAAAPSGAACRGA